MKTAVVLHHERTKEFMRSVLAKSERMEKSPELRGDL
jgi:ribosome-binding factor A